MMGLSLKKKTTSGGLERLFVFLSDHVNGNVLMRQNIIDTVATKSTSYHATTVLVAFNRLSRMYLLVHITG